MSIFKQTISQIQHDYELHYFDPKLIFLTKFTTFSTQWKYDIEKKNKQKTINLKSVMNWLNYFNIITNISQRLSVQKLPRVSSRLPRRLKRKNTRSWYTWCLILALSLAAENKSTVRSANARVSLCVRDLTSSPCAFLRNGLYCMRGQKKKRKKITNSIRLKSIVWQRKNRYFRRVIRNKPRA